MEKDHKQLWEECLKFFKDNVSPEQYNAFFKIVTSAGFENNKLELCVPSQFFVDQLEERFLGVLGAGIHKVYGNGVQLFYRFRQVQNAPDTELSIRSGEPSSAILAQVQQKVQPANPFQAQPAAPFDSQLNPFNTFENYCGSMGNREARAIGESVARKVMTFNPLFVFGPTGVGKTHLIQAIGIRAKELDPSLRVLYINARLFESQFTAANRTGSINSFFHFYQSIDMLIVDDIQELAGKTKTQNMFFHIFNHLKQNGKQIILSSDCPPSQMEGFEARVLNRFKWGMTQELERPDIELRRDVLRRKAEQDGLNLPDDVIDFIAANVTDSIREIVGVVASLMGRAMVLGCEVNLDLARRVVSNVVKINERRMDFETIADRVSSFYGIEADRLFTNTRKREISDARQIVMYIAKTMANMSLKAIGARIGRSHATVLHGCNCIEQRLGVDRKLTDDLKTIEAELKAC
ncbi:MAG: chromosomal replication initiator protein DnaA [Muribaculaceae bacterium]|nr:chromosomal replication initiator protein DnaA [Muribaculaceae bacterium]MDE6130128.1 chromosomal replication initiator protein DnaA [Muribaculaceae bacterium]